MASISKKTTKLTRMAIIIAVQLILTFTPFIGYIPLGFTRATIVHIPVIIGSVLLGPVCGGVLGFVFGLTSLYTNTFTPTITSFVFSPFYSAGGVGGNLWSLVICFVPRILVGVVPYYICRLFDKAKLNKPTGYCVAGLCGSMVNTLLVMGMIYVFFGEPYSLAKGISFDALSAALMSIICINGIPEAILAAVLTVFVVSALKGKK